MYYLAIVQNGNTQSIYSYATEDEATAAFHAELAYRAEGRTSTACIILDSHLHVLRQEEYIASVQSPEPNEG